MGLPMSKLPHGPRVPPPLQLLKWVFAPLSFMQACADRYGDTFTVRTLGFPPMVFFTDPGAIRQIFTGDPDQFRCGKANAVFEVFFGPNALLLLDGARHRRERRLLIPPFHGERMRLYGEMMCDEEIRDEMFTMLVAGHETTATLLAWVIHRLLENPDVLAAARAEVASVVGTEPHLPPPTAEQIARLGYLDAAIKETARLHLVVPIVVRQLETDHTVGCAAMPAGCIAAPCIYLVHRRPDLWPEPDSFDPGRFVGRRTDPYTFFPFGGGVRHCLGAAFATCEMKIALAACCHA